MAIQLPFGGGADSGTYTPADVQRRRRLAEALMADNTQAREPFGALAKALTGARAGFEGTQAREAEEEGITQANQSIAEMLSNPNVTVDQLIGENGMGNPWANSGQQAILQKLIGEQIAPDQGNQETYFGTPLFTQDAEGNIIANQLGNQGTFNPIELPEGQKIAPPTTTQDTGTEIITFDRFGNELFRTPKQNQEAARQSAFGKEIGAGEGAAVVGAPGDIRAGETALGIIDQIRNHPDLQSATGLTAPLNEHLIGTGRFDFQNMVEQAKSGAFLTAIQEMRGLGALSNAEGQTATAAVTRMNTALDQKAFLNALADYEAIVQRGVANAQAKLAGAGRGNTGGAQSQPVPVSNDAEYQALPKGAEYVDPDGNIRVKK